MSLQGFGYDDVVHQFENRYKKTFSAIPNYSPVQIRMKNNEETNISNYLLYQVPVPLLGKFHRTSLLILLKDVRGRSPYFRKRLLSTNPN